MWPDTRLTQAGLFLEGDRSVGADSRLRFGLRLDSFEASAGSADLAPAGRNLSPNQLYRLYYGATAEPWSGAGLSALLRYEHRLRDGLTLFAGVSRSVRPADATERFLASNNSQASRRWIGNPGLDAARHHQLDVGLGEEVVK